MRRRTFVRVAALGACASLGGCNSPSATQGSETPDETPIPQTATLRWGGGDDAPAGGTVGLADDSTTALVGVYGDRDSGAVPANAALVFGPEAGTWEHQTTLTPHDRDSDDGFGRSLALSGDGTTALVGAPRDDPTGEDSGSAYAFRRTGRSWDSGTELVPGDADSGDAFGIAGDLSADGTTAVLGAVRDGGGVGSASVFTTAATGWQQEQRLTATDGDNDDLFGSSIGVSADGRTVVVGAAGDEDPNGRQAGSAYVFTRTAGEWAQEAKLVPDGGTKFGRFGTAVALSGDGTTALVGAPQESARANLAGAAYLFRKDADAWRQRAELVSPSVAKGDRFGAAVALSRAGDTAVIGAYGDGAPDGDRAGGAYVFTLQDGVWTHRATLTRDARAAGDYVGTSVAVSGSTAIVGASGTGSAFLYDL